MSDVLYTIIIYPITQIIDVTFAFTQRLFRETGFSIVCISMVISALCLPLYAVAEKWQRLERDTQKRLKAKVSKIKAVFKGDERFMILSTYYRQNRYHPVYTLRSSFGFLIQIPFFIAAYSYLSHLEALKGASFFFIRDLGAPDGLLPLFAGAAGEGGVNVLPAVMTAINLLSGAVYAKDLSLKDRLPLYGIAALFLVLLYNAPAGLVLYWTMNNVFSLVKNAYYAAPFKSKRHWPPALFSLICLFFAAFCVTVLGYISKAQTLAGFFAFAAAVPWAARLLGKRMDGFIARTSKDGVSAPLFFAAAFLLWALFGLFIPSQLVAASPQQFSFIDEYASPLAFLAVTAMQTLGGMVFWPSVCFLLFSPEIKKYFALTFFCLCCAAMVNVFAFAGNYGIISVSLVYTGSLSHSLKSSLINYAALAAVCAGALFLFRLSARWKKLITTAVFLCAAAFLSASLINAYTIQRGFDELSRYYIKEEKHLEQVRPLASLSRTGKNIVIIMLDRAISVFVPFIFEESPALKEAYSGFVYYPNTVSFNGYTGIGAPPVYGGYDYTPEEINKRSDIPLVDKHNEALLMLPRMLSERGYSVCVTDPPYANYNQKSDLSIYEPYHGVRACITDSQYTDLWIEEHDLRLPSQSAVITRNMFWYSLVKGLPLSLRSLLYMNGNWCSPAVNNTLRLTLNGYSVLDYLPRLIEIRDGAQNAALILTNNTTHEGSLLQAPEYRPVISVTNYGTSRFAKQSSYHTNAASLKRLSDWFEILKEQGVYDNTRIILVSDHGPATTFVTKIGLPFDVDQFNPLLMVKDFDTNGAPRTDMSFMSNADVPSLALNGLVDHPKNPFTGADISMARKKDPLYIAMSGSIHLQSRTATQIALNPKKDYFVHDNIFKAENWSQAK
jgi:membrane protein insertase Oxa1/YidC/SpoIIIJ